MRALSVASLAGFMLFVWLLRHGGTTAAAGMVSVALSLGGCAVFWWAVATTRRRPPAIAYADADSDSDWAPAMLYEAGPYAFVRHPFYVSYCLFWIGLAVAAGPWQWLGSLPIVAWYCTIARAEERRLGRSALAGAYAAYRARTGMLLPRPARLVSSLGIRRGAWLARPWRRAVALVRRLERRLGLRLERRLGLRLGLGLGRRRGWAKALARALRVDRPRSEQEAAVMHDQANLLYFLCLLFSATGAVNAPLTSIAFGGMRHPSMLLNAGALLVIYAAITVTALRWRRDQDDLRFLRRSRVLYTLLGLGWGSITMLYALHGPPRQAALLLGLATGLVSTPIISVPTAIAYGFFIPVAVLSVIAVSVVMPTADTLTASAFASFACYAAVAIAYTNATFAGRSEARAALQREIDTVNVFLREYEEGSSDWLWETDRQGRLRDPGAHIAAALGMAPAALGRMRLQDIVATERRSQDCQPQDLDLAVCLRDQQAFRDLIVSHERDGRRRWLALTGHPVYNGRGAPIGFRGIGRDVTASRKASEKIAFMASHDGLTGLVNRQSFLNALTRHCEAGRSFALALVDLDSFKGVNDTYGHQVGDSLLQCVARRIGQVVRPDDVAARLGGDEFAVLLCDVDEAQGLAIVRRLADVIGERFVVGGISLLPGASIGVAMAPAHADDQQRLMMLADLALYKAKEQGKGNACLYADWMEQEYRTRISQEADLRRGIADGEIVVAYQPVVDIGSGLVVSSEALVRWAHPTRGLVMPGEFIPAAERTDLMERLGELVLRIACRDAVTWEPAIQVNVNLSPRQLRSGQFLQILAETLEESGLPPRRLAIEVTETLLLDGTERTLEQLRGIRALGVNLILDDFGSGYSSLSYLHDIDVDGIKIDASFTRKLPSRKVAAIYRMVARLALDLNIYVVAEGVEEPEQLDWLRKNGIQFAQGYLLGRPLQTPPARHAEYLS
ncbi:EAL domain-containing protein [Roseomonas sp. NAR14]|uniref:EAL domain-containing protein n=1 Tax=Roseomonas acroporae TaxID=2937791 RepID=A0A9X1YAG6_9PROT|nr:EAL domain-containing protein [Roseomonas acroporae]MCK8785360.1 EAL domain-containing protein [Roseomonas acroporae]